METVLAETENFGVNQLSLQDGNALHNERMDSFHGLIPYEGYLEILSQGKVLAEVSCGQSVIIPAILQEYSLSSDHAKVVKVYYPKQFLDKYKYFP